MADSSPGRLCIVATPIGNLGDITLRALEALRSADIVACEDTRHSSILLRHYEIAAKTVSLHEHNEAKRSAELVKKLQSGLDIVLISDAGMPAMSDPGQRFLQVCIAHGIEYDVLPGPCAVVNGLVGSGLPTHPFYFGGFLSVKKGRRERELTEALEREFTSVFFESPHRLIGTLALFAKLDGERTVTVARELTKKFQEYRRGSGTEVALHFEQNPPKGEITLIISGSKLPKWVQLGRVPIDSPDVP